jgi:hypothetical protein
MLPFLQGVPKVLTLLKVYGLLQGGKDFWSTLYIKIYLLTMRDA